MGFVTPTNESVLEFTGLHLYHSGVSNCSMRVRMTLEEKGLAWTSHHLNILQKEHITPEYFGINPNGLVPTLVHDGRVIIESDDIIDYIDDQFPDPPLKPSGDGDREDMYYWLRRATAIHLQAVKTYVYYKRIGKRMAHSDADDEKYRSLQTNPDLLEFHRKSTNEGFSDEEIDQARTTLRDCFSKMDAILETHDWLAGNRFSLADIAWVPLQFTLERLADYKFGSFDNVADWTRRLIARDSYQNGIIKWWPPGIGSA